MGDVAHFRAIPWCAAHLEKAASPTLVFKTPAIRFPRDDYKDVLMSSILNRPDAMANFAVFYDESKDPKEPVTEVSAFITLGHMLNGWEGVCHGGIVMTLLDEVSGQLGEINVAKGAIPNFPIMTAYLNTSFIAPVETGTTILVKAKETKREGRKWYIDATVESEDGTLLAKAEALFVQLKAKL
ncbi:hypothetical protein OQA88_13520 [Cercophora sp. LCS_1]